MSKKAKSIIERWTEESKRGTAFKIVSKKELEDRKTSEKKTER